MNSSTAFGLLDERIQRFIWAERWEDLRDVQELAIPAILPANQDVIIAAATASGKTEAAFLPALTHLLSKGAPGLIVYVSPLKALINDQFGRLERLCENLDVPVWPWHGDISSTLKTRFLRERSGVLLITPESLEAMMCLRGTAVAGIFELTDYIIVDELHAFIGSERGKQLQSLLHRIESVVAHSIPRIGLSATLGDMNLAAQFLRPGGNVALVQPSSNGMALKLVVKGYEEPLHATGRDSDSTEADRAPVAIAEHLFRTLRGSNNLVFPNSRREVERYTHLLIEMCDQARVPNEFWPHHGNLSKEIRTDTETALKKKDHAATAICTNTLELGIDIGAVKSVAQIGPPPSVASLRQRLGRSGRREGESAVLRGYQIEDALDKNSSLESRLRLSTFTTVAAVSLLTEGWFEPPKAGGAHFSTLIQQLLSAIAQFGGMQAPDAYRLLCAENAPFSTVSKSQFAELLRHLGKQEILMQDSSGLLLHGRIGDRLVNHYSFYASFMADEEFRIVAGGKTLGTLPVSQMLVAGQRILFAGRTWLVDSVDDTQKTIHVTAAKGGTPPMFNGGGGRVHTRLRKRMKELYESTDTPSYLDDTATRFIQEGRNAYAQLQLGERNRISQGSSAILVTWRGDDTNEAISCLLLSRGVKAWPAPLGVEFRNEKRTDEELDALLADISSEDPPSQEILLSEAANLIRHKWDWALSPGLLKHSYASLNLNLDEGIEWLRDSYPT